MYASARSVLPFCTVFEPPLNNFFMKGLENGNTTATVKMKTYPEGTPDLNNGPRVFAPTSP